MLLPLDGDQARSRHRVIPHPNSPNAKMAAARDRVAAIRVDDDGTIIDAVSGLTVGDVRYLAKMTTCLNLGDTDPATWPAQNVG